jgi:hypothetical protein
MSKKCGAKHISKLKYTKHAVVGPRLEVEMSKKWTPLWRENVKMSKKCGMKHISKSKCTKHTIVVLPLEVEMSKKWTPLWREAHFEVKM